MCFAARLLPALAALTLACASESPTAETDTAPADIASRDDVPGAEVTREGADDAPGADVPETGAAGPGGTVDQLVAAWCPEYATRYCQAATACGCAAAPGYPDAAACRLAFAAQCGEQLEPYRDAVARGEAEVRLDGVAPCLAAIAALAGNCAKLPGDTFFVDCPIIAPPGGLPALPGVGAPCGPEGRCAAGLRCDADGDCAPRAPEGGVCASDPDCAPPLRCVAGSCGAPDASKAGDACAPSADCGDLVCAASARKVCMARAPGNACQWDDDCVAAEYCAGDACVPLPGDGQPCGNGVACAAGLGCGSESAMCGALPGDGAPCALGVMGPLLCVDGTTCRDGVCGPIPGEGAACAVGTPACAPGLGCAFGPEGSFCRVPGTEGTRCENDPTCAAGLYCEFTENACRPVREVGMPCAAGNECGPTGACLPDATFTFRCAPVPQLGDACFLADCAPGLSCRTPYAEGACVRDFCGSLRF